MVLNLDQYKLHCQSYLVQIKIRRKQPRDDNIFCIMHLCQGRGSFDPCISSKASGGRVREPMQSVNDSWCFNNFLVFFSNCFLCFQGRWKALKVLCCKTWIVVFLHSFSDKKNVHPGPETLATPTRRYCKGWYISQFASHWNFKILIPPPWNSRIDTQNWCYIWKGRYTHQSHHSLCIYINFHGFSGVYTVGSRKHLLHFYYRTTNRWHEETPSRPEFHGRCFHFESHADRSEIRIYLEVRLDGTDTKR